MKLYPSAANAQSQDDTAPGPRSRLNSSRTLAQQVSEAAMPGIAVAAAAQRVDVRYPLPERPREALEDPDVASYFYNYIAEPAKWYDLGDATRQFETAVPQMALDEPLLFSAVVALAGMHVSQTTTTATGSSKAAREVAEYYHTHCVKLLIRLDGDSELLTSGVALAAACLLRSYEILDEPPGSLLAAGFWNYLREDITFSLFEGCPLKMDLAVAAAPKLTSGHDELHAVSLLLGQIINATFGKPISQNEWERLAVMTQARYDGLPSHVKPFSSGRSATSSAALPQRWFLQDYHASAMHYLLVSACILVVSAPPGEQWRLQASDDSGGDESELGKQDLLEQYALEICGVAFTTNIPSVLVNAFGPIAYCGKFIRSEPARQEIIRRLSACKKSTGWPVARLITNLQVSWAESETTMEESHDARNPSPDSPRLFGRSLATLTTPRTTALGWPAVVKPTSNEVQNAALDARNLEKAVRHIHQDGLVVIEDVVPHADIDHLNTRMVHDALVLQARGDKGPFNYNLGNLQQDAPPVAEFFSPSVFTNPIATQITTAIMGPRPKWTFCSANSAMPPLPGASPQRQPVHSDADFPFPSHPFALVVNIPLVTMTPENGSTELWLGTHTADISTQEGAHGDRASGRIKENHLRDRQAGSIVIRDLRLWHAGMPNTTDQVRVMLAMIHFAPWYRNRMKLQYGVDVRPVLEGLEREGKLGLEVPVDWVGTDEALKGYLDRGFGNSYDFDQEA
ncbi:Kanamycin B dioxygenase [Cladobotryum mycophilum]|uniref:Kanamycin B dioxygenase n=1 Tax=Cladobotryum mycophilum TaxID=491253 RepID=A0ABR0S7Q8_9HYPO